MRDSLFAGTICIAYREDKRILGRNYMDLSSHPRDRIPGKALVWSRYLDYPIFVHLLF